MFGVVAVLAATAEPSAADAPPTTEAAPPSTVVVVRQVHRQVVVSLPPGVDPPLAADVVAPGAVAPTGTTA